MKGMFSSCGVPSCSRARRGGTWCECRGTSGLLGMASSIFSGRGGKLRFFRLRSFLGFGRCESALDPDATMQDARDPKTIAEKAKPLAEHRRSTKEAEEDKGSMSTINGRRNSSYLTARIARDCPAILEEMKAGKYPSVRAAAKAARVL